MKLCIVDNMASFYRGPINIALDNAFDCEFYFGENKTDIKEMDIKQLKYALFLQTKHIGNSHIYILKGLSSLITKSTCDTFIVIGDPYCISTWFLLLKRILFKRQKKIYLWTHGWYGRESKIKVIVKKIYFSCCTGVFTYGTHAKRLMAEEGLNPNKIFVIHNSLNYDVQISLRNSNLKSDLYVSHFNNKNKVLLFIGRLTQSKRLNMLLQVIYNLRQMGRKYNLVLVGDGSDKENLVTLARSYDIEKEVWFYGACYDEKINAELIYNADLCVSPGEVGLTAIHSMTFGTPVVTHNNYPYQGPEFEAIREGLTGSFYKYNDIESLTNTIKEWFSVKEYDREKIRQNCYKEIDTSWNPHFQLEVFKNVLA